MKILIIRLNALGDITLTSGVVKSIKESLPQCEIHFCTYDPFGDLVANFHGIRSIYTINRSQNLRQLTDFAKTLPQFDFVFDLHGVGKSRILTNKISGKKFTINKQSLLRRFFVKTGLGKSHLILHNVEKYALTCFPALNLPIPSKERLRPSLKNPSEFTQLQRKFNLPSQFVAIHPFASQKNKEWPYFLEFFELWKKTGIPLIIIGKDQFQQPTPLNNSLFDLSQKTTLQETLTLLHQAKGLLSTDSGPLHMGIACDSPTMGIFGPTTKELGFFPEFSKTTYLENIKLKCRPCHIHGGHSCPKKHFKCMNDITPKMVFEKLTAFLDLTASNSVLR